MKKAEGLPLNIVIIAIIALLVLVVLVVIFSSSARNFVFGTKSCTGTYSGTCKAQCGEGEAGVSNTDCQKTEATPICCKAI